jgi:hypothetical protein
MNKKIRFIKYIPFVPVCLALLLPGCAALALSALGAGAGVGIPYVVADCADRTLNYPYDQIYKATPEALQKLDIALLEKISTKRGEKFRALARELDITVDVEILTASATRVTVNATKNSLVKDKATAEEILNQIERILAQPKVPEAKRVAEKSPHSLDASNNPPRHLPLESKEPEPKRVVEKSPPTLDASNKSPRHPPVESIAAWPPP